ncbi:acyltransferase domain-containing protein, partial [Streptomyces sp. NPDC002793]|uniref:acyltransferase domain-containing protein n=1 Tax=Streptomyces sp. NPDC002793 TaxID=3154432 RepID=UPI00331AB532
MDALPEGGAMLAVEAAENELELPEGVDLAAVNGPTSLTVSGSAAAVGLLEERLRGEGRRVKRLSVSHAFHSYLMEPMLAEFAAVAESLTYRAPEIPVLTTASGDIDTPAYWVRQVREPVRFADAVRTLPGEGVTRTLELGPDGVLTALARRSADALNAVPALRVDQGEVAAFSSAVAHLYVDGTPVDWNAVYDGLGARRVDLPTYAFRRRRYWLDPMPAVETAGDPADADFWHAVEDGDADGVADALGVTDEDTVDRIGSLLPALGDWRRTRAETSAVDAWRYRVVWRPVTVPNTRLAGSWLVVGDEDGRDADGFGELLRTHGADDVRTVAHRAELPAGDFAGILVLPGATPTDLLPLLRGGSVGRVWVLTRGVVAVGRSERVV